MEVQLDFSRSAEAITVARLKTMQQSVTEAHTLLHSKSGKGSEYTGWLSLPENYDKTEFARIQKAARHICETSEVLVVLGIGGSYLGARAIIEALAPPAEPGIPEIYFAGNNMSASYLAKIMARCEAADFSVNVVSKSGTTTETAVAFRFFKEMLEKRYGKKGAAQRVYATTDPQNGALRKLAEAEGYETFAIPANVGGRYSALTAVGLLPAAVAGINIGQLMAGAAKACGDLATPDLLGNLCYQYAACRNLFYKDGKQIELLCSYEPELEQLQKWYIQLFGESEGKNGKGLFPAMASFTTDLHSMGQYIQEGPPVLFETVLNIASPKTTLTVPAAADDFDGLGYLEGRPVSTINRTAMEATILAHAGGGVPNLVLTLPKLDAFYTGYLLYFMEKACAISGYLLDINPFDQPGVEAYKRNMFALLGKPGYEKEGAALKNSH